jgi:hypothetical protein
MRAGMAEQLRGENTSRGTYPEKKIWPRHMRSAAVRAAAERLRVIQGSLHDL